MKTYQHVTRAVFGAPWYTTPDHLATIADIVRGRAAGEIATPEDVAARLGEAAATAGPRGGARIQGAVAIIPVYGTLMSRANLFSEFSGGATYQGIGRMLRDALADEAVGSILFDIDSPGGEVAGCDELATEIRNSRGRKPMVALADALCASAAYYLAAQCDEVVASPSSLVGSIGCLVVHAEESRMLDELGVTVSVLRDPPLKAEVNPWEPLSEAGRAHLQERATDAADLFRAAVAKGRGVPVSAVKAGYGQGRVLTAKRALEAKLVDRIGTLDETIVRLASGKGPAPRGTTAEEIMQPVDGVALGLALLSPDERAAVEEALPHTDHEALAAACTADDIKAQAALAIARAHASKR